MTSISSSLASISQFSRADTNSSGGVELEEFIAGRPSGVSEAQATTKFAELDTENTGSLSEEQLAQGDPKNSSPTDTVSLSSEALTALLELTQNNASSGTQRQGADIFSALDTDGSGTLNQEEFVSGRPDFASEEDAIAEFARLDSDEDGSLTFDEIEAGNEASSSAQASAQGGKPPPPPPPPGGGGSSTDELYDELDTNEDGVVDVSELMAGLEEDAEEEAVQSTSLAASSLFAQAISAYGYADAETSASNNASNLSA